MEDIPDGRSVGAFVVGDELRRDGGGELQRAAGLVVDGGHVEALEEVDEFLWSGGLEGGAEVWDGGEHGLDLSRPGAVGSAGFEGARSMSASWRRNRASWVSCQRQDSATERARSSRRSRRRWGPNRRRPMNSTSSLGEDRGGVGGHRLVGGEQAMSHCSSSRSTWVDVPVADDDLAAGRVERALAGGELAGNRERGGLGRRRSRHGRRRRTSSRPPPLGAFGRSAVELLGELARAAAQPRLEQRAVERCQSRMSATAA
ncbi:hypothetical protein BH20ACT9_BH20ACT9_16440 [soil metagenome]